MKKRPPNSFIPILSRPGNISAISSTGASPRKRYIGFSNELPPVNVMASSAPSSSSICANSMLSLSQKPPRTPSAMLTLAVTATDDPTARRTACTTATWEPCSIVETAAPLVGPLVQPGRQERAQQIAVTEMDLDRVETRVT